jgi:hypothetical protein
LLWRERERERERGEREGGGERERKERRGEEYYDITPYKQHQKPA